MDQVRLAYAGSHPIQYEVELLRLLDKREDICFRAFYYSRYGLGEFYVPEFEEEISWGKDLLRGYNYEFLPTLFEPDRAGYLYPWVTKVTPYLRRYSPDAVWIRSYVRQGDWAVMIAANRLGIPILFRGESHLRSHKRSALKRSLKATVLPRLFDAIDAFLAIGTLNKTYYEHYGVEAERIYHVPYCVDNDYFQSCVDEAAERRGDLQESLGIRADTPVILFLSKLIPRKRPLDLLAAFREVNRRYAQRPSPVLVFVGAGPLRSQLEGTVGDEVRGLVHLVGFKSQKEVCKYYDLADVFVLPSQHEPWGLVVNEAMNAGLPIIATQEVGAAHDLVEEGENGFLYGRGDITALADRLLYLLENPRQRERMGKASRDRIEDWSFSEAERGIVEALGAVVREGR